MNPIKLNKRHIVLASIIISIGIALSINYWISPLKFSQNKTIESSSENSTNINEKSNVKSDQNVEKIKLFFKNEKDEKEKFKNKMLEISSNDPDYTKKIIQEITLGNNIESLIKSKFDDNLIDCMAIIEKNRCNIIVSFKTDLTKEYVYKIKNIVKDHTDFKNNEITVTEKKIVN